MPEIDSGTTAWVLASAALVLFMTPGLAFFYGGMTRSKSVLNMIMMSFSAIGVVSVLWVLYGYTLAFGADAGGGLIGNLDILGLKAHHDGQRHQRPLRLRLRRLPDDVRHHHAGADQRRDRRPDEVRLLGAVLGPLGRRSSTSRSPTGSSPSARRSSDDERRRRGRRRGRTPRAPAAGSSASSARSTSPAAPRCTSTPAPRGSPWSSCSASARASAATRCARTTCRWS